MTGGINQREFVRWKEIRRKRRRRPLVGAEFSQWSIEDAIDAAKGEKPTGAKPRSMHHRFPSTIRIRHDRGSALDAATRFRSHVYQRAINSPRPLKRPANGEQQDRGKERGQKAVWSNGDEDKSEELEERN